VEFRILGPVEIWAAGRRYDPGSPKEACVLASLLLAPGRPVSAETIVDHVWGLEPPAKARNSVWSYIARLRRTIAVDQQVRLVSRSGLYVLEIDPESVDLHRFRQLRAHARVLSQDGESEQAAQVLHEADALWRGEALAGLPGDWAKRTRISLENERMTAAMERVESDLAVGNEADVAGELSELVLEHPFAERFVEQLMVALYRSGRQAEALDTYRQARSRLVGELGTEPGPNLSALHQQILRNDPALTRSPQSSVRPSSARHHVGPNNLPRDIPYFTGRNEELGLLAEAIMAGADRTAVTVVAIDGMAGVGKSTLAIHLAHRLADRFHDGQIFLSLHAHHPYEEPVDPATALDRLLRITRAASTSAPEDSHHQPGTLELLAASWRQQVARRRMLIVLDDAATIDQVRPLLPGTPGCVVLITSRRRLAGLVGARSISLDVMRPAEAAELFTRIVGPERSRDEAAIGEVARLCGNMPLAIQLAASRLRHRRAWSVTDLARLLSSTRNRLREIRGQELEVASSFELSYRYLPRREQAAFRQAGCYPGPDFSLQAAAAANNLSFADTDKLLDGLLSYHLLEEPVHGRFRYHDLVREYAHELAVREEPESARQSAMHRLLDYYLYGADRADRVLFPHRHRLAAEVNDIPAEFPAFDDENDARGWMESERQNILSAVQYAAANEFLVHVTLLPHMMAHFLEVGGYWKEAAVAHESALAAWRSAKDQQGQAHAHADLCLPRVRAGYFEDALGHGREALAMFRSLADERGAADCLDRLGLVHWNAARYQDAQSHFDESLALQRVTGNRHGEAEVLGHSGVGYWHVGRYTDSIAAFEQAMTVYREINDKTGEAKMLNNIGAVEQSLGIFENALSRYQQALPIARERGRRQAEAVLLNNIGNAYRSLGHHEDALASLRSALGIYLDIGDRRCEADTLNNIGTTYHRMSQHAESLIHHEKALAIARELTEEYETTHALRSIGDVYCQMGDHRAAEEHYQQALALSRQIGDPYEEACSLDGLGNAVLLSQGQAKAEDLWRAALAIFERLGVPEASAVRSRLGPA
jgi:DNA-binding SARP family transcriptional activator/tetratricopeptide (TPR) repeat protein